VDADRDGRAGRLVLGEALDVDDELGTVDLASEGGRRCQTEEREEEGENGRPTWTTLPSRPLYFPRVTLTSSFLRIGRARAYGQGEGQSLCSPVGREA
jgi:hypothetical protein